MIRLTLAVLAFSCAACSEAAHFRGPATYTLSSQGQPARGGALEQGGLVCANATARTVLVTLGDDCVLYAAPSARTRGHAAVLVAGQRCVLPLHDGRQAVVVRSGTLVADASQGVDLTIGASPVDEPSTYMTYRLTAGPPRLGGDACDVLLARAPPQ